MKRTVPREVVDARRSLEEGNGSALRNWGLAGNEAPHARNASVVEAADHAAQEALCQKITEMHISDLRAHSVSVDSYQSLFFS